MNIMSLDLEMNQTQTESRIIQVGFTVLSLDNKEILLSKSININCHETLNPFITQLTGITQENVDDGIELDAAYDELYYWHQLYECFMNPITWGGGDSIELKKQLLNTDDWCFGRRWIDVKTLYVSHRIANGRPIQGGLKKACQQMGVLFAGPAHNSERDAYNTAQLYLKFLDSYKII